MIDPNYQFDKNLSYFENMERLRESFGVEGKLYSDIEYTSLPIDDFDKEHIEAVTKYTFTPEQDGIIYINHDSVQLNENKQFLKEYLKGENNFYFSTKELGVWQEIAFVKAGETYSFNHIKTVEYQDFYLSTPEFKFLNYETAKNLCIKMQENQAELKQTKNGYEINLNNKEGNLVVFSINLNGLNFMLDGKEIEANDAFGGFISTNVTKANQKLIINYSYPYLWIWILAMVICVGLAILIYHWHKKTQLKKLQKPIYAFWWILTCLILSIFYIFCIFLTIFKLIF